MDDYEYKERVVLLTTYIDWEDPSAICILRHKPVARGLSELASKSVNNSTDDTAGTKNTA